jgi:diguanylate cyclase (GGDEF)-like protein/PAS domain S-box-containing protein
MEGNRATRDAAGVEPRLGPSEVAGAPEHRLLVVHDRAAEADRAVAELEASGLRLRVLRVDTLPALDAALRGRDWDLVLLARPLERIADDDALARLAEAADACPVIVLGQGLDDETILELSAAGVSDVVEAGAGGPLLEAVRHVLAAHGAEAGEPDPGLTLAARIQDLVGMAESLEEALAQTLELVCAGLQQPYGESWVRVPDGPEFRLGSGFAAHAGLERLRVVTAGRRAGGEPAGGGRVTGGGAHGAGIPGGIVREVVASRRSRVVTDLSRDGGRRFDRARAALASGLDVATAVPVVVRNRVEAVMLTLGRRGHAPDPRVRGVMEVAAKHLAASLGRERETAMLARERRRLQELLDLLGEGVMACDGTGEVTLFNRALERFHGRRAARGIARDEWPRAYDLYLADGVTAMRPGEVPILRALGGESVEDERFVIAAPGVRRRTVRASARPLRDASGAVDGALMVVHDESQIAAASEALAGASERAVRTFTLLLDHLADLALRVGEAHRLSDAWPAVADFAERTLGADELRVIRSETSPLDEAGTAPAERILFEAVRPATAADVIDPAASASAVARDAMAAGRLAVERDASYPGIVPQRPMRSAAAVPMVLGERILGALEVRAARPFAFDEGAAVALTMAATLAAIALDHADLVEEERRSRELAEASARHFQQIFVANPAAVAIVAERDWRVLDVNPAMEVLTGWPRGQLVGRSAVELGLWEADANAMSDANAMVIAPGGARTLRERETQLRRGDGSLRTCLVSVEATELRSGEMSERALLVLAIDVTERLEQQKQLGDLARFRESLVEFIGQTLSHGFDETFYQRLLEAAVRATPGAEAGSLLLRDAPHGDDRRVAEVGRERGDPSSGARTQLEVPIELDGQRMALLRLEGGPGNAGFDEQARDLAAAFATQAATLIQRRALEHELEHMAYHDSLTGLPNRTLFRDRLQQAVARSQRTGRRGAALFVDLDNLKVTNDTLGHGIGDGLLQAVGERLRSAVRAEDTVARIGGDEFTLVLPEAEDAAAAALVAEKILRLMRQPFRLLGHELHVSVSMGITLFPDDATDADTLIRHGDAALYHAKAQGKDRYRFFTAQMNQALLERASLEARLRIALQRDEFGLRYQPRVSLVDGRITSVEALARWRLPERGDVPPATFIAVAEEAGLIGPLGSHLLRLACQQGRAWSDAGVPTVVAVNLSAKQLQERDVVRTVLAVLRETGLDPSLLELELTESAVMHNVEENVVKLGELRDLGVQISIDDFGTAYSSLNYLKQLPATALKIDRSFVRDVAATGEAGRHDTAIVRAVVALAKALELVAIAEGVETLAQLRFLREIGCEQAQGYLLARPAAAADLAELLQRGRVPLPDDA